MLMASSWERMADSRLGGLVRAWERRSRALAVLLGTFGYAASLSPSLIPRSPVMQGVVSGVSLAAWYAVGVLLGRAWRRFRRWSGLVVELRSAGPRRMLAGAWAGGVAATLIGAPLLFLDDHRALARDMGMPEPGVVDVLVVLVMAAGVFAALVLLWHGVRRLFLVLLARLNRLPSALAAPLASVLVLVLVAGLIQYVIVGGLLRVVGDRSAQANLTSPPGTSPPVSSLLSGGPGSTQSWADLGYEGRAFVSGATTATDIARVTGQPSKEPIRAYAGRVDGRSIEATVVAAMAELDRTGAWQRSTLLLFTTTGQGWVNNWSASAVEYLTGGDCALVAVQHSVLPSPLALIDAPNRPREAGRALTSAVLDHLETLPADARPKVYVAGESLGAYGGNAAFTSLDDMLDRIDGAVWTGTPSFTELHRSITARRVVGSTQMNPIVDNGRHVRFASRPAELAADQFGRELGPWDFPRVVYLQHPSDPVVWWEPSLLLSTPDWLRETRVASPAAAMSWLPVVTFWQVTADMPGSTDVPSGKGHNYHAEVVPTWAAVLDRGTPAAVAEVTTAIERRAQSWE